LGGIVFSGRDASYCQFCQNYQCLVCGEEFPQQELLEQHLSLDNHVMEAICPTTNYANRPIDSPEFPALRGDIKLLRCRGGCSGTPSDASKLDQYVSKCRCCQQYRCLLCGLLHKQRKVVSRHVTYYHMCSPLREPSLRVVTLNWVLTGRLSATNRLSPTERLILIKQLNGRTRSNSKSSKLPAESGNNL